MPRKLISCKGCSAPTRSVREWCQSCSPFLHHPQRGLFENKTPSKSYICPSCNGPKSKHGARCMNCAKKDMWGLSSITCARCDQVVTRNNPAQKYCKDCVPNDTIRKQLRTYGVSFLDGPSNCQICNSPVEDIDHDHVTGRVRGFLCHRCNTKIAVLDDDEWVTKARNYLTMSAFSARKE